MTKKEKKDETAVTEAEIAEEIADANAEDTQETEESTDGEAEEEVDNKIDYEAELAKEREARKKAEEALAKKRFDASKRKREEEETIEEDESGEEKPLTAKQLQTILAQEREQTEKIVQETRAHEIVKSMAPTEAERNLILEIYKNRVFPSHLTLEDKLEESYAIANRKKLIGERNEALRALKNKGNVNKDTATGHRDAPLAGEPKMSPQDMHALKGAGFMWNSTARRYEKKLSNGDTLVRDQKTKRTFIVKKQKS